MKKKTKGLWIAGGALAGIAGALAYVGHYFYNYAINTKTDKEGIVGKSDPEKLKKKQLEFNEIDFEDWTIQSFDDLKLHAYYYPGTSHTWFICVHGYTGSGLDMGRLGFDLNRLGYHVLMPDQRGHGQSEGDYVGMGHLERYDVLKWIYEILSKDNEAKIILQGRSMGASTVMMVTEEELPENVVACIEDCGFTSAIDLFNHQMKNRYPLPMDWAILASNLTTKARANYFFEEADALKAVKNSITPTLFIHGTKDDFVPYAMVHRLYEACSANKQLYIVKDADHVESYKKDPQKYVDTIIEFIKPYIND